MASRVTVNVVVRDLTRGDVNRISRSFNRLGRDINAFMGRPTQQTFRAAQASAQRFGDDLQRLRGRIPEDEFRRLNAQVRMFNDRLRQVGSGANRRQMGELRTMLRGLDDDFRRLHQHTTVRVRTRVDTDRNGIRRAILSPLRGIQGLISGTLSDGIGQGIASGAKAGGPAFAAALVTMIVGLASIVGAALAGLFVTAFGLAFATLGGISAARSKEVQKDWASTLERLKKLFAEVGQPMIPVLQHGIQLLDDMATRATPAIKKALEGAAPSVKVLMDKIAEGFQRFGQVAFKPLMDAFSLFAPVFGEVWSDFMNSLGNEFKEMAGLVKDHSVEIEMALRIVFGAITLLVKIVNYLAEAWIVALGTMGDAAGFILTAVRGVAFGFLSLIDGILTGIAAVESVIPGVGHKARDMRDAFRDWRKGVDEDLSHAADSLYGFDERLAAANKKRKIEMSIRELTEKLTKARNDMNKTTNTKAQAKIQANIDQLTAQLKSARRQLDTINGKTATTYVYTYTSTIQGGHPTQRYSRATGGIVGAAMAHGGVRSAIQGMAARNMTLVGEQGPELVQLAAGSRVRSNPDTRRTMRESGGQGAVVLEIRSGGSRVDDMIVEILRHAVKIKGGNVQLAVMGKE